MANSEKLDRLIDLLEEEIELSRERNQLLGEVLNSLDNFKKPQELSLQSNQPFIKKETPKADFDLLCKAIGKTVKCSKQCETFWPKTKAPENWVRVAIKYSNSDDLVKRISEGCLCGKNIIIRKSIDSEFFTCEGVAQKGGCDYRPSIQVNDYRLLINLPPAK